MFIVRNSVIVPYNVEKMFFLVNNISSYSSFIPGCVDSRVLVDGDSELIAEVVIFKFGIFYSFVTHNIMVKNRSIVIKLVDGPCKSLCGIWKFIYLDIGISKVECSFQYDFHSVLIGKVFNYVIEELIHDTIKSFMLRANKIYNR